MATAPVFVPLEEYNRTSYSPDCEYVDGTVLERNVGKRKHSFTQGRLVRRLSEMLEPKGFVVLPEQRIQVAPTRVRIPDVCVVPAQTEDEVLLAPPALCVEVISPDDRWSRLTIVFGEYLSMGVPHVWLVDPYERMAWHFDRFQNLQEARGGVLLAHGLEPELTLKEILPSPSPPQSGLT